MSFLLEKNENYLKFKIFGKKCKQIPKILSTKKWKTQAYVYTLRSVKYNEIIYFVLSVKLREEIVLHQTPINARFYMQIIFSTFLKKVSNQTLNSNKPLLFFV